MSYHPYLIDHAKLALESYLLRSGVKSISPGLEFTEAFQLQYHGQIIKFSGVSFQRWINASFELANLLIPLDFEQIQVGVYPEVNDPQAVAAIQLGEYLLVLSVLPAGEQIALMTESHYFGSCYFDAPVSIPVLFHPETGETWMSLTPQEVATCRPGVKLAQGRTLIGGLGLGWQAKRILEKPEVEQVTIVEINSHIIENIGLPLLEQYGERCKIVCDDLWQYLTKAQLKHFDACIIDVWAGHGEASDDLVFQRIKRLARQQGKTCWGWGDIFTGEAS